MQYFVQQLSAVASITATLAAQQVALTAPDAGARDNFGTSVALSQNTALVGAPLADLHNARDGGAAYVFSVGGAAPSFQQKLSASDKSHYAKFGARVALSADSAVVAAVGADPSVAAQDGGALYAFARMGSTWVQQQILVAGDPQSNAHLGASLAMSGDRIIAGAPEANGTQGAAYVFERAAGVWAQKQKLVAPDGLPRDRFGSSVAIVGDTLAVGAFQDDELADTDRGSVYVFARGASAWNLVQKIVPPQGDFFGRALALSSTTLLAGRQASASAYARVSGAWTLGQQFSAIGFDALMLENLALSECALVAGSPNSSSGSINVFRRDAGSSYVLDASFANPAGPSGGRYGFAIAAEGLRLVVGAPLNDLPAKVDAGIAYLVHAGGCTQAAWSTTHVGGAGAPGPRIWHALASDTDRRRVVLFGGLHGLPNFLDCGDTWEWDGAAWNALTPVTAPPARRLSAMAYDSARQRTLLFGGQSTGVIFSDLWEWDGANWTSVASSGAAPGPTSGVGLAYDSARNRIVLYGGATYGSTLNAPRDTWEWQGTASGVGVWTKYATSAGSHPGVRLTPGFAYDKARGVALLHGGRDAFNVQLDDTWAWDGQAWTQLATSGPIGGIYYDFGSMAYDESSARMVLAASSAPVTWVWSGAGWTSIDGDSGPRTASPLVWDSQLGKVMRFSGLDPTSPGPYTLLSDTVHWCGCGD